MPCRSLVRRSNQPHGQVTRTGLGTNWFQAPFAFQSLPGDALPSARLPVFLGKLLIHLRRAVIRSVVLEAGARRAAGRVAVGHMAIAATVPLSSITFA